MSKPKKGAAPSLPQTTNEFLDAVKQKFAIESDYKLADKLQVAPSMISHYRSGHMILKDGDAIWIASLLEIEPAYVMTCAHAEKAARANRTEEQAVWEGLLKKLTLPLVAVALLGNPAPTYAQDNNTNYTNKRRRKYAAA